MQTAHCANRGCHARTCVAHLKKQEQTRTNHLTGQGKLAWGASINTWTENTHSATNGCAGTP
eukprot:14817395-Alexandrium_andersonii.AAC.1